MELPRILLVDDEQLVLDGLRDRLHRFRRQWKMEFVCGGPAALSAIKAEPFDVLVTDLRMPHVDGFAVLDYAAQHCPQIIRVVLSGGANDDLPMQLLQRAHQAIAKPARPNELEGVLERASKIRSLVTEPNVRAAIGTMRELARDRRAYERLTGALGRSEVDPMDVARAIESDVSLTATTLRLVNSNMLGDAGPITSVLQATARLGIDRIGPLLEDETKSSSDPHRAAFSAAVNAHCLLVSEVCRRIAPQNARRDSFTAGLLHDLGWLVTDSLPAVALTHEGEGPETFAAAQHDAHRMAAVGAYVLGLWGLPLHIIDAVAHLHREEGGGELGRRLRTAHRAVEEVISRGVKSGSVVELAVALASQEEPSNG